MVSFSTIVVYASAARVRGGDAAVADDRGHLRADPALRVRMPAEQVQRIGQRGRGGLVAGEEEDQHLVAHLGVGQRRALVARVEQQPQHVLRRSPLARRRATISSQTPCRSRWAAAAVG